MLQVFRHYLPLRRAALLLSETLLLAASVGAVMSAHLWNPDMAIRRTLAALGLSPADALGRCLSSALLLALLAQVTIGFNELYDLRVSSSRYERASRFIGSAGSTLALSILVLVLAPLWGLDAVLSFPGLQLVQRIASLTVGLSLGFVLLYLWRPLFHLLLRRFAFDQRILILGAGNFARELASEVAGRPDSGYEVVGLLPNVHSALEELAGKAARESGADNELDPLRPADGEDGLLELARRMGVDTIAVALEDRRAQVPMHELLRCRMGGIEVVEGEKLFERTTGKLAVSAMRPSYMVFNEGFRQNPMAELGKRALDIALALGMLLVLWPVMLGTAALVALSSPGGALYKQERVGRYGRGFTLMKFRSMRADAEAKSGPVWAKEGDPRITPVGRMIRKTRLDELPQLFNVLSGDMSLIGPRPERPKFVAELSAQIPYYGQRHIVKPGLTGWAQINYPYGNTVEDARQKLQYDLFYIKNRSLLFDLSILFNTIKTVVLRRGT